MTEDETAADVLVQLDDADFKLLVAEISFPRLVALLNLMEVDDEADIIRLLQMTSGTASLRPSSTPIRNTSRSS